MVRRQLAPFVRSVRPVLLAGSVTPDAGLVRAPSATHLFRWAAYLSNPVCCLAR